MISIITTSCPIIKMRKAFVALSVFLGWIITTISGYTNTVHHSHILWISNTKDSITEQNIRTLYPTRIIPGTPEMLLVGNDYNAAIIYDADIDPVLAYSLEAFALRGGVAVLDLKLYAELRALHAAETIGEDEPNIIITAEHPVTRGLSQGDELPWYRVEGDSYTQTSVSGVQADHILAESSRGGALLILEPHGHGFILATDLSGLGEPFWSNKGEFNKYLFLGNALGQSVRFGRHYDERYPYDEFIGMMAKLANDYQIVQIREEGDAYGDYHIHSLVLGDTEKPAIFSYATVHGGEWEPAFGLLRLAEILAQNPDTGLFDFDKYHLVLVPIFNPSGYDADQRNSLAGVDLNRPFGSAGNEPEIHTFKAMLKRIKPLAILDFHNNAGGDGYNRLIILPGTFDDRDQSFKNEYMARKAAAYFNEAIKDRYVVHESRRTRVEQFNIEAVWNEEDEPRTMVDHAAQQDIPGFLVELAGMYPDTYGLTFITDLTIEMFFAFVRSYSDSVEGAEISQGIPHYQINKETLYYLQNQSIGYESLYMFPQARVWGRGGKATFLLHSGKDEEVNISVQHRDITTRQNGIPLLFTITGPDGSIVYNDEVPFYEETDITFTAPSAGIYTITATPIARGVVLVPKSNRPINVHLGNERVLFRVSEGDYSFWVPAGVRTFAIRLSGSRTTAFSSKLLDDNGNLYEESGDASIYEYWVKLNNPSRGEFWTLQVRKPEQMESASGFYLEMRGIPPLISASTEQLVVESVSNTNYINWINRTGIPTDRYGYFVRNGPIDIPNLLSYAFGIDPMGATKNDLPKAHVETDVNGEQFLEYTFKKNPQAEYIQIKPEVTSNLIHGDWESGEAYISIMEETCDSIRIRDKTPLEVEGARFFRLRVSIMEK